MKRPEILAPAGGMEALTAALRTGADAVYAGGKNFSARNNAANFSNEELAEAVRLCHIHNAKLYLAVNTIISDTEAEGFCRFIKFAAETGVDGYIVQDIGAAHIIRSAVPNAVLHGSTQLSVHTVSGVKLLKSMGFERAVPARELSADTLKKICREDIEIEVFVHGALCMSVSGQCYMSAMIGSRSANRGCCGQACRLPFSAAENKSYSALSLKDLSLLGSTDELCRIGVDSLKIEGRMKRPEYIAAAVTELQKALDGSSPDMQTLRGIFSRSGFTDGYFSGKRQDMFGVREKDDVIAAREMIPKLHELYRRERTVFTVDFHAEILTDKPMKITARIGDISAEVTGNIPDMARNAPTDAETVKKQLSKLGDTVFKCGNITVNIDNGLFVPTGRLNELRRLAADKLTEKIIQANKPEYEINSYTPEISGKNIRRTFDTLPIRTFCRTEEQAEAAAELSEYVIVPESVITLQTTERIPQSRIIISPPRFIADEEKTVSRLSELRELGFERLLCHTLDTAAIGKALGFKLHGSFTMNMFNSFSAECLRKLGFEDCIASTEMTVTQLNALSTDMPVGAVIYGWLPLMLTRNCPIKNEVGCRNCTGCLTDRTTRSFPVACFKDYVETLNSDILYMGDRLSEIKNISFGAVLLNEENAAETKSAVSCKKPDSAITRGLYYRGVL